MFGRKTKKIDPGIRFQHRSFTRRLDVARHYKRQAHKEDQTTGKTWRIISFALALAIVFYIIYIPNPLFIKRIVVTGVPESQAATVRSDIEHFWIANRISAQQNRAFFSKKKMTDYLLKNDKAILNVNSIRTYWFKRTLDISVIPRVEAFSLDSPLETTILFNDGTVARSVLTDPAAQPQPSSLLPIVINYPPILSTGQQLISASFAQLLLSIQRQIPSQIQIDVDHIELPVGKDTSKPTVLPLDPPDISVFVKDGWKAIFDTHLDLSDQLNRLQTVIKQTPSDQQKKLFYIDLRFKEKAYVCYKNLPCAQDPATTPPDQTVVPATVPAQPVTPIKTIK